jgi:hypothetical protein
VIGSEVPELANFGLVGLTLVSIGFRYVNLRRRDIPSPSPRRLIATRGAIRRCNSLAGDLSNCPSSSYPKFNGV